MRPSPLTNDLIRDARTDRGTYRDRLKPLIDASDQHVLSIFSYSGDACGDHVDRGLLTLVTNQDSLGRTVWGS